MGGIRCTGVLGGGRETKDREIGVGVKRVKHTQCDTWRGKVPGADPDPETEWESLRKKGKCEAQ